MSAHRAPMSAAPEVPTGDHAAPGSKAGQMFKSCWSCRVVSGGGLILAGAYVFHAARTVMRRGGPTSMGTVAQITFAASERLTSQTHDVTNAPRRPGPAKVWFCSVPPGLAAWGVVVVADPVGKAQRKT